MRSPTIRPATTDDLPAILDIFNQVVATSTAVYSLQPTTLAEREGWYRSRVDAGFPVLVATGPGRMDGADGADGATGADPTDRTGRAGSVLGFASFGDFRGAWPGYRYAVEHSVHVREDCRGRGIGPALVQALFPLALAMGKHVMVGGVDAANHGSLRMHERLGFERVAHFREVGHKFGRWLDLVFLQRFLDAPGAPRDA